MSESTRTALVTGAASGIGAATTERLARDGYSVIAIDVDGVRVEAVAERLQGVGGAVVPVIADVRDRAQLDAGIDDAVSRTGTVTAICVNAGIGFADAPFFETSDEVIDDLLAVNLRGAINTLQAAGRHLVDEGSVIFTSSTSGLVAHPGSAVYGATKIALVGLARSLAAELAPRRIRVNAVCPGGVRTELIRRIHGDKADEAIASYASVVPLGRAAEPEDIAAAIAFLASDAASHITGIALRVDGGDGIAGVL